MTGLKIIQNRIKTQDGLKALLRSLKHNDSRKTLLVFLGLAHKSQKAV